MYCSTKNVCNSALCYSNSQDAQAHIDSEKEYFSKGHKSAIDNGNKIGWDMWVLENPGYRENHTTFIYAHLQDPDKV